ncbi:uncharacterized protein LOC108140781 isoform X1 [Drosophila elegans]|uniref:uncharacterized protein LOC108140781 isoform X1 n=1 Tax=Drosophila elegans TaxID=30023 RepID=UPI0007E6D38E|nr:uncharacterized protein LOC108140781 isoform X1 [Drosophila elegans]
MSNIKYQPIPTEDELPREEKPPKWIVKICFLIVVLLIIAFYDLNAQEQQIGSTTEAYTGPSEISLDPSTTNTPWDSSSLLDVPYDTSTIEVTEIALSAVTEGKTKNSDFTHFQTEEITEITLEVSTWSNVSDVVEPESQYALETESGVKYFVNSPECQMSHPNPFASNILKIYRKHHYIVCDQSSDMIKVIFNKTDSTYRLHMQDGCKCCYKQILRAGVATMADHRYRLRPCVDLQQDSLVPTDVTAMITYCRWPPYDKVSQKDAFSFVHPRRDTLNDSSPDKMPSVLLWGIDSISRMTLERAMPQMHEYLNTQHWFELQGYNKMGDNTFPNLMAVLTGFNKTFAYAQCRPDKVGGLDACPLIWKDFKAKGYTTAFAEDWSEYSTFDYSSRGFFKPPTDVYGRPLILAVEKELKQTRQSNLPYCLGRKPAAEYIYDLGVQFASVNRNSTFFGMFWTNTFSHNDFSMPSAMDARMVNYMRTLDKSGVMDNTLIIFFSDHGSRFGPLRKLDSGFVEERLPFIYIRVPHWIREKYPKLLHNLQVNRNRLTSPYDIHATLRHFLELDTPPDQLPRPEGCPTCHSVLVEADWSRNCSQAGIEEHWCACDRFAKLSATDPRARIMSTQLVEAVNGFVAGKKGAHRCRRLSLSRISSVQQRGSTNQYLIQLKAQPGNAILEATVQWDESAQRISIRVPSISRLDSYFGMSGCTSVKETKKFCIC